MTSEKRLCKRLKRFCRYYLIRLIWILVSFLPLALAKQGGALLGAVVFLLARKEKNKALASLSIAFPEKTQKQRWQIAFKNFCHLGRCAAELCCMRAIDRQIQDYVEFLPADRQLLQAAIKEGKGVLFISGHVGNFELLARRIAMDGFPSQTIAKETSDPRLTRLIEQMRSSGGLRCIWRGQEGAARHMLRALRKGELLGLLIDQDTKVQGVFVDFFGKKAFTPRAAADLALRTGAALVVGFAFRRADGGHRLTLKRIVTATQSNDQEQNVINLTQELTSEIENAIRQAPDSWVWMHRRWKTRPGPIANALL